jgi:hypothetical protein
MSKILTTKHLTTSRTVYKVSTKPPSGGFFMYDYIIDEEIAFEQQFETTSISCLCCNE